MADFSGSGGGGGGGVKGATKARSRRKRKNDKREDELSKKSRSGKLTDNEWYEYIYGDDLPF